MITFTFSLKKMQHQHWCFKCLQYLQTILFTGHTGWSVGRYVNLNKFRWSVWVLIRTVLRHLNFEFPISKFHNKMSTCSCLFWHECSVCSHVTGETTQQISAERRGPTVRPGTWHGHIVTLSYFGNGINLSFSALPPPLCLVDQQYEFSSRVLPAVHPEDSVWLVQAAERPGRRVPWISTQS